MTLNIIHEVSSNTATIEALEHSLRAYNFAEAGPYYPEILLLTARDEKDHLQGGLKGVISSNWLFIDTLWVAESNRHKGLGSRLLLVAEEKAKANSCVGVFLDTQSYQAPDFYKKHGYIEFGKLENFPPGHSRIYLSKTL